MAEVMARPGNPSSPHAPGRHARELLERSRRQLAARLGVVAGRVVFTAGGTEANNLALLGLPGRVSWTFVDFDRDLLMLGAGEHGHRLLHGVGLRLDAPAEAYDLVVVSSRLRGLWPRWGADITAEARRVGRAVAVPFRSTVAR